MVATCRTLRIGGTPTPGFTITSDKYTSLGPFTANLTINFPTQPGKTVTLVSYNYPNPDTCIKDVILNTNGVGTTTYSATTKTTIIYATLKVGASCCIGFDTCTSSNYASLTVIPIGNVTFISIPETGAEIFLAPHGQTPVDQNLITTNTISNLPVGTYDYILKKTGYNDASGSIDILEGQTVTKTVSMTPAQGCIYFDSTPQMAEIWMNGSANTVTDTTFKTPKLICNIGLGSHVYKLTLPGYEDIIDTAILGTGSGLIITKTLRQTPMFTDIIISPTNPSVTVGNTLQFNAEPIDQYNNPFPATVTWSNSNSFVGNIDTSTGLFTALHVGTSVVTASSGNVSKSTTVTVTQVVPVLTTITVSPPTLSIQAGNSSIFTAHPLDQFGNPISVAITWASSNTSVGTIDKNGVFSAIVEGTTVITASSGGISGIAVANVSPAPVVTPVLTTITVTPSILSIQAGNAAIFTAHPLDQFGNPISATITWTSSNILIGKIDQNGVFSAISPGTTVITASSGGISGSSVVNVTPAPALNKIVVSPSTLTIQVGNEAIFTVSTLDQFNNPFPTTVTWTSSNTSVGTIDQNGVFTAISAGTTTIMASSAGISGVAAVNVTPTPPAPKLSSITISPSTLLIQAGNASIFTAHPLDQFGNPISATITWTSFDPTVGTIDQNGVFTAISPGTTTIMASSTGISGIGVVNVTPAPVVKPVLTTIKVTPDTASIIAGKSTVFIAISLDQYGNPIPTTIIWTSSNTSVGTIDQTGTFTSISPGTTIVKATSDNISGSATVNVTPAPVLNKIIISPSTLTIQTGNAAIFTAQTLDQFGNSIPTTVTWSSSDTSIGTIDQNGAFVAKSQGSTTITAYSGDISGIAIVNVTPTAPLPAGPILSRIIVSPLTLSIQVKNKAIFTAETLDQTGNIIPTTVTWSSSDPSIGTIDANTGVFTAKSAGSTTITAKSGNISGVALANVSTTPPVQAGMFPITGDINTAALILGVAVLGAVLLNRPPIKLVEKPVEIEEEIPMEEEIS